jgi:transposase InsO family protein
MRRYGIRAIMARPRRVRTTDSHHDLPIAPNLIVRNFTAAAPARVWLADITYIPTAEGWLYLAAVMDLFSRKIVGWAVRDARRTSFSPTIRISRADSTWYRSTCIDGVTGRGLPYKQAPLARALWVARFARLAWKAGGRPSH